MKMFHRYLPVLIAALLLIPVLASAQQVPLQDKPFAEHKIVLQLSDNDPKKQGLVISVANIPTRLRSGGDVRSRHRSAKT
jgi:hypothetical protein